MAQIWVFRKASYLSVATNIRLGWKNLTRKDSLAHAATETFTAEKVVQYRSQWVLIWVFPIVSFLFMPTNIIIELESFTMKDWKLSNVSFLSMATNNSYSINITMIINLIMILIIKSH